MLTIEYDGENGECVPDFAAEAWVLDAFANRKFVSVGSELMFHAARVLVAEGKIPADQIEFWFKGKKLSHNPDGTLNAWEPGLCDTYSKFLGRLLRAAKLHRKPVQ